jgi:radical SAM superfamily enzyme YgiQ (UPF0313 family)
MVMPQGILSLAALAESCGVEARVIHTGLGSFSAPEKLNDFINCWKPDLVFCSIHWHHQVAASKSTLTRLSREFPELPIVAGGLTASFFAREAMDLMPTISAVVRGDGEASVGSICGQLANGEVVKYEGIPNIVYRGVDGRVKENPISYVLNTSESAGLEHARFELLENRKEYLNSRLYADFFDPPGGVSPHAYGPAFYYNPGKGCSFACAYCGGSRSAQLETSNRIGYFFYGLKKIVRDLRGASRVGLETWRVSFDPSMDSRHWLEIMSALKKQGMKWRFVFDTWAPPSTSLIDALADCALQNSVLTFSPECGNESLRSRLKGWKYSNKALEDSIKAARKRDLGVHIFVSAGLPGETQNDVDSTIELVKRLRECYNVEVTACPMELDPASELFCKPKKWRVRLLRKSLNDFASDEHPIGYETEYFREQEIFSSVSRIQNSL